MGILQTAERSSHLDPSENVIFQRHMIAYMETAKMISGTVLEIGCGEGYGLVELAPKSEKYLAIDKYPTPINEELKKKNNITFQQMDVPPLTGIQDDSIDFVVTFQVIEHINNDELFVSELYRVLKPGGVMALSVPRYLPELICWKLSKEYSQTPGGHVRIFRHSQLKKLALDNGLEYKSFHWAHGLHSPYWWLQCLFWRRKDRSYLVKLYHRFLVWDLMQNPLLTRILEAILQPLIGKSLVMYFRKPT